MKLVVNLTSLLTPLTGIGHYTAEMLKQLDTYEQLKDVVGVSPTGWHSREQIRALLSTPSSGDVANAQTNERSTTTKALRSQVIALGKNLPGARRAAKGYRNYLAKRRAAEVTGYVYWEPNYTLLPINNSAVTTIHDLSHLVYPQFHPKARLAEFSSQLADSVARAERILTVSAYTKGTIEELLDVSPDRIDIAQPAVSDIFRVIHSTELSDQVAQRHGLPQQFLLYVGTLEPRKNLVNLLRAFRSLPNATRRDYPLVLVGAKGWLNAELDKELTPMLATKEVIRLGYVDQADLPVIYQRATCLCYVSYFEGYGMPIAEAMAAGTPVITSNTSSMPEVAQNCALLVSPDNIGEIREAILKLTENSALQADLAERGRLASAEYTWNNSAAALYNSLSKVTETT